MPGFLPSEYVEDIDTVLLPFLRLERIESECESLLVRELDPFLLDCLASLALLDASLRELYLDERVLLRFSDAEVLLVLRALLT